MCTDSVCVFVNLQNSTSVLQLNTVSSFCKLEIAKRSAFRKHLNTTVELLLISESLEKLCSNKMNHGTHGDSHHLYPVSNDIMYVI